MVPYGLFARDRGTHFIVTEFFLHHEEVFHNTPDTQTESVVPQLMGRLNLTGSIVVAIPMYIRKTSSTSRGMRLSSLKRRIRNEDTRACLKSRTSRMPTLKTPIRQLPTLGPHRDQSLAKHLQRSGPLRSSTRTHRNRRRRSLNGEKERPDTRGPRMLPIS